MRHVPAGSATAVAALLVVAVASASAGMSRGTSANAFNAGARRSHRLRGRVADERVARCAVRVKAEGA